MTVKEKNIFKRAAQEAMEKNGIKVFQKDIILLETGNTVEHVDDLSFIMPDYVMFEEKKTGKIYQCFYNPKYYTMNHKTCWAIEEYIA